jgi:hypothetical protein
VILSKLAPPTWKVCWESADLTPCGQDVAHGRVPALANRFVDGVVDGDFSGGWQRGGRPRRVRNVDARRRR